uniref:Uncharacterized protein n=1 Tax=Arundo donax TaxID=35708 RepID=A0A0A9H5G2_ARUDO
MFNRPNLVGKIVNKFLKSSQGFLMTRLKGSCFFCYNNKATLPEGLKNWENNALLLWNNMIYQKFPSYVTRIEELGGILLSFCALLT